jgi:threonine synthase
MEVYIMSKGIIETYEKYFPIYSETPRLSLSEGSTPLVYLKNLSSFFGIDLWAKYEGLNPTGSFKDRGMVLAVSKAVEKGAKALVCASTGNTSASAAAYAAHAGLPCFVILPSGYVATGKMTQALVYGAKVISVRGNFDRALELARKASEERHFAIVNSVNPYRLIGQRSASWEICDDLGHPPDWLVIPVGNAGNISAYYAGFEQYLKRGKINCLPRMMGIQAEGAAPMVRGQMIDNPETVATAIRIGHPVSASRARRAVKKTGGGFYSVTDQEIIEAQRLLASSDGIFAEPASCTTIAFLMKMFRSGELPKDLKVTCVLTGNGLKDPEAPLASIGSPKDIEGSWQALEEVLSNEIAD